MRPQRRADEQRPFPQVVVAPAGATPPSAGTARLGWLSGGSRWLVWVGAAVVFILASRVRPGGLPAPLVMPLVVALLEMAPPLGWTAAWLGAGAALTAGAAEAAALLVLTSAAVRLQERIWPSLGDAGHRVRDAARLGAVLVAGALVAAVGEPASMGVDQMFAVVVTAILTGMTLGWMRQAAAVLLQMLPDLPPEWNPERAANGPAVATSVGARRALLALAVLAAGGLDGLRLLSMDLGLALRGTAILLAAELGGLGWGAVTGVVAGLLGLLAGHAPLWTVAWCGLVGGGAGLLRPYGRAALAAGFCLATLVLAGALADGDHVLTALASAAGGLAAYAAITATGMPRRLGQRLRAFLPGSGAWVATAVAADTSDAPRDVSPVQTAAVLPAWSHVLKEMGRILEADGIGAVDPKESVGELVHETARRHCLQCPHVRTCWQREFVVTYQALVGILADLERDGTWHPDRLPPSLRARCPRLSTIVTSLSQGLEVFQVEWRWRRRTQQLRRLMGMHLRDLAELGVGARSRAPSRRSRGVPWRYGLRIGVARTPKEGRWISGDGYMCRTMDDEGRMVLAISDGMGSGRRAASESRSVLRLLEAMLDGGLRPVAAVRMLNTVLALRDVEVYTALDMASVDLERGQVEFIKVGAAPSFLRRHREVQLIFRPTLPAGCVQELEPTPERRTLQPGDLLVMVSDGVLNAFGDLEAGVAWVRGYLAATDQEEPRRLAAEVIKEALRRTGQRANDDMTVLIAQLLPRVPAAPGACLEHAQ